MVVFDTKPKPSLTPTKHNSIFLILPHIPCFELCRKITKLNLNSFSPICLKFSMALKFSFLILFLFSNSHHFITILSPDPSHPFYDFCRHKFGPDPHLTRLSFLHKLLSINFLLLPCPHGRWCIGPNSPPRALRCRLQSTHNP